MFAMCLSLLAAGCHERSRDFEGKWYGQSGLTVQFDPGGSFLQNGKMAFRGKWIIQNDKAVVTIDEKSIETALQHVGGAKRSKLDIENLKKTLSAIEFSLSDDGKTLTQMVHGFQPATYTRTKA